MTPTRALIVAVLPSALSTAPLAAHDIYTWIVSPEGESCCNQRDCAPAEECYRDGQPGFVWQGHCLRLPPELQDDSRLGVCLGWLHGYPMVRCWTGPIGL